MAEEFLILSLKWTKGETMVWYRPNSHGYTANLDCAGRFSAEEASRIVLPSSALLAVSENIAMANAVPVVLNLENILEKFKASVKCR